MQTKDGEPVNSFKRTLQLGGWRYFPVTYCSSECLASGARAGCVMAAKVTNPATDIDTTSIPPNPQPGLHITMQNEIMNITIYMKHFRIRYLMDHINMFSEVFKSAVEVS